MSIPKTHMTHSKLFAIAGSLFMLIVSYYVLWFQYPKVRHFAISLGHRITAVNLPQILSAIAWPIAAIVAVVVLRVAIRHLIDRIKSASVGGDKGTVVKFEPDERTKESRVPEIPESVDGVSFNHRVRDNVANTYWVGADLMTLSDIVIRGGSRDDMLHMFRQANHHLKVLRLKDSPLYGRFRRLYDSTEQSFDSDWNPARRLEVAREVSSIAGAFGRMVEETQHGFSGDPQTSADL
jgi:hypothetical protein